MSAVFRRVADALGWTPGQAWTVAVGLVVALPAALLGLGPTLQTLRHPARLLAPPAAAAPAPAPAILGNASATAPVSPPPSAGAPAGASPTGSAVSTTPAGLPAPPDSGVFAAIQGGTVH